MADFKISRIRFRWAGDWSASQNYIKDDIVRYGSRTYVALKTHTSSPNFYTDLEAVDTQIPPQADPIWELMLEGYEWASTWLPSTFYQVNDIIKKNGIVYICIESHTSVSVEEDFPDDIANSYWIVHTSTDNWLSEWNTNTYYSLNDVVKYNGLIYRCVVAHTSASTTLLGLEDDIFNWNVLSSSTYWRGDWTITTRYKLNDLVRYNGIVYRCLTNHLSTSTLLGGLESDLSSWVVFYQDIEYRNTWSSASVRYKKNDIVKYGANIWICNEHHTSSLSFDQTKWSIYIPGFEYEALWDNTALYQPGDIVSYGGYNYYALTINTNQTPSVNSDDWELLHTSYRIRGDYLSANNYLVGDVVRRGGMLYIAIADSQGEETTNTNYWRLVIPGERFTGAWDDAINYLIGDIVTYVGTAYRCVAKHTSNETNRPDLDLLNVNWVILIQGNSTNVLAYEGDIKTRTATQSIRREIGTAGDVLKVINGEPNWNKLNDTNKVYYVSLEGDDNNTGDSLQNPFRTIKHACDSITGPATIFVKTGIFQEIIPISVPANVALVGDELRGTTVEPAPGLEINNMFYVRNASGIRNMTLRGLSGSLTVANAFGTSRPTAGAYVSLDPGTGNSDSSVWITTRSPYIQNVTTFGTGCVGMKVDGALHDGGNRSIVANDFTQVLSDGIGAWVTNLGLSELVSVFTYYNHIGYLAENGGKIRGTNGNCSYGTFGASAEGFDTTEIPITGKIDNRSQEALVGSVITNPAGNIIKLEYLNCGQEYSLPATYSFNGAGINASATTVDIRDDAIYQIRIITPGDSSPAGGTGFVTATNNAQLGDTGTITLAATDPNDFSTYFGMRVVITGGTGVGQYGVIYSYNDISKIAGVLRESDDQIGWDHVLPGTPIENSLDTTTVYRIEPRVQFPFPGFSRTATPLASSASWVDVAYGNDKFVAVASGTDVTNISSNGITWLTGGNLPSSDFWSALAVGEISGTTYHITVANGGTNAAYSTNGGSSWSSGTLSSSGAWVDVAYGNSRFIAISTSSNVTSISTNGSGWTAGGTLPLSTTWNQIAYGNGIFVVIQSNGTNAAVSTDNGITWNLGVLPATINWSSITYGNGRFVAVASGTIISAYSFDGITWYQSSMPSSNSWSEVSYGQGVFLAVASGSNTVAYSNDGYIWTTSGDDSTQFTLPSSSSWSSVAFGNPSSSGIWVAVASGPSAIGAYIYTGARTLARAEVVGGKVNKISIWNPGSGYINTPSITVTDPNSTSSVFTKVRRGKGVLSEPYYSNRGTGYLGVSTTVQISGNGFSDNYQTGDSIILRDVTVIPGPGDNVTIDEINDVTYKIITITNLGGTAPNYNVRLTLSPSIGIEESPEHLTDITIRQRYSQVRLTGHDFLDIGVGNFQNANYPNISILNAAPENEIVEKGGGRCFYTSTDQDGNFRVGELFKVEQATGTVTISANIFNLSGLSELRLGGVTVGGTGIIIREFSSDGTFTADSNNIIPTQKAIKAFLNARISGGGANALASILVAGVVRVGPAQIDTTTGEQIDIPIKVNMRKGIDGDMLAQKMFLYGTFFSDDDTGL